MEENQNEIPNAESIGIGTLESTGTRMEQKRILEDGTSAKPDILE